MENLESSLHQQKAPKQSNAMGQERSTAYWRIAKTQDEENTGETNAQWL
ncbi:MAG: hypothetical protein ACFWT0_00240 [Bifidobacterium crudilactis]|jgi:hypothetical protein